VCVSGFGNAIQSCVCFDYTFEKISPSSSHHVGRDQRVSWRIRVTDQLFLFHLQTGNANWMLKRQGLGMKKPEQCNMSSGWEFAGAACAGCAAIPSRLHADGRPACLATPLASPMHAPSHCYTRYTRSPSGSSGPSVHHRALAHGRAVRRVSDPARAPSPPAAQPHTGAFVSRGRGSTVLSLQRARTREASRGPEVP